MISIFASSFENPTVNYANDGTYTVSLTVTGVNGCQSTRAEIITVVHIGINEISNEHLYVYYSGEELVVKFKEAPSNAIIKVYDSLGKLVLNRSFANDKIFKSKLVRSKNYSMNK